MRNEKHVALAEKLLSDFFDDEKATVGGVNWKGDWIQKHINLIATALSQIESEKEAELLKQFQDAEKKAYERGKSEALASKVCVSEFEIRRAVGDIIDEFRSLHLADSGYGSGKFVPDMPTAMIDLKEMLCNWMKHFLTPNEPEVNAQGFNSWFVDIASQKAKYIVNRIGNIANRPDLRETQLLQVKEILELVMEANNLERAKAKEIRVPDERMALRKRAELEYEYLSDKWSDEVYEEVAVRLREFEIWFRSEIQRLNQAQDEQEKDL